MKSNIYRLLYEISLTLKFNIYKCIEKKERIQRGIIKLFFTAYVWRSENALDVLKISEIEQLDILKTWTETHPLHLISPSPPSPSLKRSIRIGGKKKPQDDKREINIEVYCFIAKCNEAKCERRWKKWNTKLNQRLYNQRTVRPLKQREEIKSISIRGCFFQTLSPVTWWFS